MELLLEQLPSIFMQFHQVSCVCEPYTWGRARALMCRAGVGLPTHTPDASLDIPQCLSLFACMRAETRWPEEMFTPGTPLPFQTLSPAL